MHHLGCDRLVGLLCCTAGFSEDFQASCHGTACTPALHTPDPTLEFLCSLFDSHADQPSRNPGGGCGADACGVRRYIKFILGVFFARVSW